MSTILNPYINFKDNARQAMEFYKSVFGGELRLATFKDYHASQDPSEENLIMHAELHSPSGVVFFASDTSKRMEYRQGASISMSLTGENEKELKGFFQKLASGGKITMPLEKAAWGDTFGMCTDKYGVNWMVNISAPKK
jgi:PhnB protein